MASYRIPLGCCEVESWRTRRRKKKLKLNYIAYIIIPLKCALRACVIAVREMLKCCFNNNYCVVKQILHRQLRRYGNCCVKVHTLHWLPVYTYGSVFICMIRVLNLVRTLIAG